MSKDIIPDNLILPFTTYHHTKDQVVIERGEGPYLIDVNGKRYFDGFSSLWVASLGHNHPIITKRIVDQAQKIAHASLFGGAHIPAIELTQKLLSFMGLTDYSVFYSNSGSEAIEASVKMVMDYWREHGESDKKYIVTFEGSYHGETTAAMNVSGFEDHQRMYPHLILPRRVAQSPLSTVQARYTDGINPYKSIDEIVNTDGDEIGAIIIEPVFGAGGILFPDDSFLKRVETICKENGYLFVVDEVATGFYRTGTKFCYERLGFKPDIVVLGKALTAGYLPLAATVVSSKIGKLYSRTDKKPGFVHGHTFSGNPLACSAALGNLEVLESTNFLKQLSESMAYFNERLTSLSYPTFAEIRYRGFFAGIELFDPRKRHDWNQVALEVCNESKRCGVLIRPLGNTIVLAPPYTSTSSDLDLLVDTVLQATQKVLDGYGTSN